MISAPSVLALSLMLGPLSAPAVAGHGRAAGYVDLFVPPVRRLPDIPNDGVKRSRTMRVNGKAIRAICGDHHQRIRLVLFPKIRLRVHTTLLGAALAKGQGPSGVWHAKSVGKRRGTAAMAFTPGCIRANRSRRQLISGVVRLRDGRVFQVTPVRPGRVRIEQLSYTHRPGSESDTPDPRELRPAEPRPPHL